VGIITDGGKPILNDGTVMVMMVDKYNCKCDIVDLPWDVHTGSKFSSDI
jgi:hypothetical protein